MIAAVHAFGDRQAAELAMPHDQRGIEQAAALQVLDQARDRLVGLRAVLLVVVLQVPVRVPARLEVAAAGKDLHEADAALDQPARHQRLPPEVVGRLVVDAVQLRAWRRFPC